MYILVSENCSVSDEIIFWRINNDMALLQLKLKLSAFGISYDGVIWRMMDHTLRDWGLALFASAGLRRLIIYMYTYVHE